MLERDSSVPRHVAIIMDGNGRWAKERGLPRIKGHEEGANAVRACVEGCGDLVAAGVQDLTRVAGESVRRDVDTLQDLRSALGLGVGPATAEVLRQRPALLG